MTTRYQLTSAIDRLHKEADDIRLCIGLGDNSDDQHAALDTILDQIDRLNAKLADHDIRQAQWRAYHVAGLIRYHARMRGRKQSA